MSNKQKVITYARLIFCFVLFVAIQYVNIDKSTYLLCCGIYIIGIIYSVLEICDTKVVEQPKEK